MRAIRSLGRGARALMCALALLGLTLGTPFALLAIGSALGEYIPGWNDISLDVLLRPDDGGVAYAVLLAAGWVCWAMFAASVALELPAAFRGRTRRHRVRGLGWSQHMAAFLLSGIALTVSVGAAGAADASATPTPVLSAPIHAGDVEQHAPTVRSAAPSGPTHIVAAGDTLWSIAEDRLGDGTRWADIAELNEGLEMPDGRTFDASRAIHAGWRLRLPVTAHTPAPQADTPSGTRAPVVSAARDIPKVRTVTVVAGDTLSAIAERELGDADRYPEIVQATRPLTQPDGMHLTDANRILPGWTLALPADADGEAAPDESPSQPSTRTDDLPAEPSAPEPVPAPTPVDATPTPEPVTNGFAHETTWPATPTADTPERHEHDRGTSVRLPATLGLGTLSAAGILTAIAVRRRHQQRVRPPQRRIALPDPPAATYEQRLRGGERPERAAFLDLALRSVAAELAADGRPMPTFTTAHVTGAGIELRLSRPEPAAPPFRSEGTDGDRWVCRPDAPMLSDAQAWALPAPCPALAPIAESPTGEVLSDLESCGVTTLVGGTAQDHREILRALAVGLLTATWGEDRSITLVGVPDIAGFEPPHNPQLTETTLADALRRLAAWQRDSAPPLAGEALDSARAGRTLCAAPDTWPPAIVLCAEPLDADAVAVLTRLEAEHPRAAWAVVAPIAEGITAPSHWHTLPAAEGPTELTGIDGPVTIHRMTDPTHTALVDIVTTAARTEATTPDTEVAATESAADSAESADAPQDHPFQGDDEAQVDEVAGIGPTFEPEHPAVDHPDRDPVDPYQPAVPEAVGSPGSPLSPPPPNVVGESAAENVSAPASATGEGAEPELSGPDIVVLGQVAITGVGSPVEPTKRARLTELACYLVLNPGRGHADVDAALWPDSTTPANRHTAVSKLRRWLGTDADGDPHLPMIGDAGYRLGPHVTCDWHRFQRLARRGLRLGDQGVDELTRALELVRGKPFAGTSPRRYIWAEYLRQEMISAIVDVAARLGELHLTAGDVRSAKLALGKGLEICPESETLYRTMFRAAHASGGQAELETYVARLNHLLDELDCDMDSDTIDVLNDLLDRR